MTVIIGIAGGSGSGKSTLAKNIAKALPSALLIAHDDYYLDDGHLKKDFNYDHPSAFETELLLNHLDKLSAGEEALSPIYDYSSHRRSGDKRVLRPSPVIIVEGILVLENEELRKRTDLKIFVDTTEEQRLLRRVRRDTKSRGRTEESVRRQFEETVKPMHDLYVEPQKSFADIIIKNGGKDEEAVRSIVEAIAKLNLICR